MEHLDGNPAPDPITAQDIEVAVHGVQSELAKTTDKRPLDDKMAEAIDTIGQAVVEIQTELSQMDRMIDRHLKRALDDAARSVHL